MNWFAFIIGRARKGNPVVRMILSILAALIVVGLLGLTAYVRFAPTQIAQWHVSLDSSAPVTPGRCAEKITLIPTGAKASCLLPGSPAEVLEKLDASALTSARTLRLAGTPEQGLITWEARSFLMGFPDYITAQTRQTPDGTRLDILSRQRFGEGDMGVNAARLQDWLNQL